MSDKAVKREKTLTIGDKITFSLGSSLEMWGFWLYPAAAYAVFNIYLGVSPVLVGTALMLIRLIDAFSDPICGWISDNTRTRFGRRRPFILIAGILSGIGLPLLFAVSESWKGLTWMGQPVFFWFMLVSSFIYIPIVSLFAMPWNSLGAESTPDYDERTNLMAYKSAFQKIFEIGNFYGLRFTNLSIFLLPAVVEGEMQRKNTLLGMQVYTSILGLMICVFSIIMFFKLKERYYEKVVVNQERIGILSSMRQTLGCKPFRTMLGFGLSFSLGTSMVGSLGYYATVYHVCRGDTIKGDNWNFWMGICYMVFGFFGPPFIAYISHKTTKITAAKTGCFIGLATYFATWFLYNPEHPLLQVFASGMMAFSAAGIWMMHSSIGVDIVDYDELITSQRREGAFASFGSWILKLGSSLGYWVSGMVLSLSGFDAAKSVQTDSALLWIRIMLIALPVGGLISALFFISRLDLTKARAIEIAAELEERRGSI
jgi:glycoside/pentoside/hexuronide:cation symporter, GPH family